MALSKVRVKTPHPVFRGYNLFWHWHPAKLKAQGPSGWWIETWDGCTQLVPLVPGRRLDECLGPTISDPGHDCDRCGWRRDVIQA